MDSSTRGQSFEFSDYNQRVVVATLILITSVVGSVGNALVIAAVMLSKVLHTKTISFMVNMSTAHLLCSVVLPWDVVALLSTGDLPSGDREWLCSVTTVVISITIGCGIYTLATLAFNHLLLITRPTTTFLKVFTPRKIAVWLAVTWLVPLAVIVLPPLLNVGKVGLSEKFHLCGVKSSDPAGFKTYNMIRVLGLYPIPLVCILACYGHIWSSHGQGPNPPSGRRADITDEYNPGAGSDRSPPPVDIVVSPTQMINQTMPFVVAGFLVLLAPYAVCLFIRSLEPAIPYASGILFSSCCVNPIFYGLRHHDFKTVFACILRRRWNDIPQPSAFLNSTLRQIKGQGKEAVGLHAE